MQSTRQFKKVTRKEPTVSSGISVHTSEPLYVKGQAKTQVNVPEQTTTASVESIATNGPAHVEHRHDNHYKQDHSENNPYSAHYQSNAQQHHHEHGHHQEHVHIHQQHYAHHDHNKHHDHSHHDHVHDHSHHDHAHHNHKHVFSPVYIQPLPPWSYIFSNLLPEQKTLFTWFLIHLGIGFWLYCLGVSRESLSMVGFAYLMIFDALGVLNTFVSSVLRTYPDFTASNTKRPYGTYRYEIVFALGTTIYLLFATMNNTKESLEHFLLQDQHHGGEAHHKEGSGPVLSFGMFLLMGAAISATCLSSISLRNHESFVRYLRKRPTTVQGFTYNVINRARASPLSALSSNIYSLSIALCGAIVLISYILGIVTPLMDKILALSESAVTFYLGYPTAKALAKVLLQTTPNSIRNGVENRLREIQRQESNITSIGRAHFWQTTYGKCVGTIEIYIRPEADEQAVLELVYQKLEGLTNSTTDNNQSELTVCIIKQ
ncbi:hypothetical protein G6F70_007621 [Rhizopus microsporus]|uniref:Cation efflux protein transmembrane domain-containing protein n=2 Tax=Rhizopus TaxID=4842 RepID=A0A367JLI4_RHIAZ|nr:hypothetical protein G6F71_007488 [Rhizopus microsporus]RCH90729.1 hypothetical protein CU097_012023 [Rhizopus azygosporus]KAG1196222.1 hypothetical protein G6F70_007621 [Rhizopus microsporus]KAG1208055.1 hypothetical protein G6F69_007546 [Rhizopus microsporus]KAG1229131.1 hypothetical protein G6F67_007370 [Rhizopus microsporus]